MVKNALHPGGAEEDFKSQAWFSSAQAMSLWKVLWAEVGYWNQVDTWTPADTYN